MEFKKLVAKKALGDFSAKKLIIACEDTYIVKEYFEIRLPELIAKNSPTRMRPAIVVEVLETKDSRSGANHVLNRISQKMETSGELPIDSYWVMIDRDRVQSKPLNKLAAECFAKKVNLEIATPCFALWLCLHLGELEKEMACGKMENWLCEQQILCGGDHKNFHNSFSFFTLDQIRQAVERGKNLYESNPEVVKKGWADSGYFTGVHRIVEKLV